MVDFARVTTGNQAVRLHWITARIRQLCYFLAQKDDPEVNA